MYHVIVSVLSATLCFFVVVSNWVGFVQCTNGNVNCGLVGQLLVRLDVSERWLFHSSCSLSFCFCCLVAFRHCQHYGPLFMWCHCCIFESCIVSVCARVFWSLIRFLIACEQNYISHTHFFTADDMCAVNDCIAQFWKFSFQCFLCEIGAYPEP